MYCREDVAKDYPLTSVEKSTTEKYVLKFSSGWAIIYLDDNLGNISIESDWGSWSSMWGAQKGKFKKFLLSMDDGYILRNLNKGASTFFADESVKKIKKNIIQRRLYSMGKRRSSLDVDGGLDKEEARNCWYEVDSLRDSDSVNDFYRIFMNQETLFSKLCGDEPPAVGEYVVSGIHPRLDAFMKIVWTRFREIIKEEVSKESQPQ